VLQLLGTSALRSRLGVAILLALVIFAVVGVGRAMSGPDDARTGGVLPVDTSEPAATVDPRAGDDGVVEPEAASTTAVDPGPSLSPGGPSPEAVAEAFAVAWLRRTAPAKSWHDALRPYATSALAAKLEDVDPVVVPASRLTGPASVTPRGSGFVEVSYPVDSGTLLLRLVVADGGWRVDGVDWERA